MRWYDKLIAAHREVTDAVSHHGIAWSLRDVQYEPETGFWHYTWDWEVTDG